MATFENPYYSLPSSPFSETLWTNWNIDGSPVGSQDESEFKLDPNWQPPIYSLPEFYCLPLDNWSNQCTTPLSSFSPTDHSVSMGDFPSDRIHMTNWAPSLDTFTASVPSAVPIVSPCTPDLKIKFDPQDSSSQQSCSTFTSNHSSPSEPSEPSHTLPSPSISSVRSNAKANRVSKTPIRCWEHSCGGRAFSSLGNYERHLREKSGRAKSFACEQCGQRFTRSTAKNKHIRYGRCRVRPAR
ncbi:hypothetical protein BDW59DRAFT_146762 [Aspergillus cavernicola]|uniref:C2H2-type domain-containing protein n=1 Tax=Aspergillus cavernicola TaxID=176166 RepID=A0ABR4IBH6_9EURO